MASAVYDTDFLSVTWRAISYVKVRRVSSPPFSANKLSERIPVKSEAGVYRSVSFCSEFIRQVLAFCSVLYVRLSVFG